MKTYKIKVSIERKVEARNTSQAAENFWMELEDDNTMENMTTEIRLSDNMEIKEVEED